LQKDEVAFQKLPKIGDHGHDVLGSVDQVSYSVQNLDNDYDRVHDCDRKSDSGCGLRDFGRAPGFEFDASTFDKGEDFFPGADESLEEFFGFVNGSLDLDDALSESDIFLKVSPSLELTLRRVEEIDSCLEDSGKMLDDFFSEVEELLERREFTQDPSPKLLKAKNPKSSVKNRHRQPMLYS
jgi:hypothetical protein